MKRPWTKIPFRWNLKRELLNKARKLKAGMVWVALLFTILMAITFALCAAHVVEVSDGLIIAFGCLTGFGGGLLILLGFSIKTPEERLEEDYY